MCAALCQIADLITAAAARGSVADRQDHSLPEHDSGLGTSGGGGGTAAEHDIAEDLHALGFLVLEMLIGTAAVAGLPMCDASPSLPLHLPADAQAFLLACFGHDLAVESAEDLASMQFVLGEIQDAGRTPTVCLRDV